MDFKKQLELVHLQWFADVDLAGKVTLLDLAQETLPGGERFLEIAQILTKAKRVPVFQDAHWEEALMATGDMFGREAYLPNGDYRAINDGLDATSGKTDQLTEPVSLYEDRGIVDCELVRIADKAKPGGGLEFRARKDNAHLRGGAIWLGDKMLYGSRSVATPLGIDGLMSRRAKLGDNCIDNGDASAGAVTSALLAGWGADKVCFLYPAAGKTEMVTEEDGGKQLVIGANSKQLWAYVTEFYFRYGMRLMDEAYLQRLANIGTGTANPIDIDKLIALYHNLPDTEGAVLYVNKTGFIQLEQQAKDIGDEFILRWVRLDTGGSVLMFKGDVPVHRWDSIKNTEAVVTA
jgi:hypothetical protein